MLALEGIPLGHRFTFLEPSPDPPAGTLGTVIKAPYDDPAGLARIAANADVVTYEFENVPARSAAYLAARLPALPPPPALEGRPGSAGRKARCSRNWASRPPFSTVSTRLPTSTRPSKRPGSPSVIKTRRFGYDGKGQVVARSRAAAAAALAELGPGLIAESFISFQRELSILAVGGRDGSRVFYPLTENHHGDGILRVSYRARARRFAGASGGGRTAGRAGHGTARLRRCPRNRAFRGRTAASSPTRWRPGSTTPGTGR